MNQLTTIPPVSDDCPAAPMSQPADPCQPTHEEIASCAYFIWLSEGCPDGLDEAHWKEAESQLLRCCQYDGRVSESDRSSIPSPRSDEQFQILG